jgi:adenylate kinase
MSRGQLVPDDVVVEVLLDRLSRPDAKEGAILDGFPRTREQAEALDEALARTGGRVDRAILIEVPTEDLVRRLSGRWICEASGHPYHTETNPPSVPGTCDIDGSALIQRADDQPDTVRARLATQLGALDEVVAHYRDRDRLQAVDGRGSVDEVTARVLATYPGAAHPSDAAG